MFDEPISLITGVFTSTKIIIFIYNLGKLRVTKRVARGKLKITTFRVIVF